MNAHYKEWLGSSTTTVHGRAALDFASSAGCEQIVGGIDGGIDGGILDLVLTDVYDLGEVRASSPVETYYHSAIFMDVVLE